MHTAPPRTDAADESSPRFGAPEDLPGIEAPEDPPRFSRALLALTAAATIAVAPLAAAALGPADSGQSAHSIPVYLISRLSHDIGHNDWAFQGQNADRVDWVASYVALGLFWLVAALWIRRRTKRADTTALGGTKRMRPKLWLRVLLAAWSVEAFTGVLTLSAGVYAEWTSTPLGAAVLHIADLCSPWWSCVAALLVVAHAERSTAALRAVIGYGVLLAIVLVVPLPGPEFVKVLLLAVPAAVPALLTPRQPGDGAGRGDAVRSPETGPGTGSVTPGAVAAG